MSIRQHAEQFSHCLHRQQLDNLTPDLHFSCREQSVDEYSASRASTRNLGLLHEADPSGHDTFDEILCSTQNALAPRLFP